MSHAELTHWKRPWCWEGLGAGGEGDDRGWDGWMASRTQWTWVWVNSGSWWWTGRPGVLRFMGSQRVGHDWATELNWWLTWASLIAKSVKNLPSGQETWVWSLGWEDPLEKEMATHSSILAWRIPWTDEPGRLHIVHGVARVGHDLATKERERWLTFLFLKCSPNITKISNQFYFVNQWKSLYLIMHFIQNLSHAFLCTYDFENLYAWWHSYHPSVLG